MAWRPKMSSMEIGERASEIAENANILEPDLPALQLAAKVFAEAEADLVSELSRALGIAYFARLIRAERRKSSLNRHEQFRLFEHVPLRITGERNRRIALERATFADVRRYCKLLRAQYRDRVPVKLKEAEALMERMKKAAAKTPGITVAEVLGL